MTELRRLDVSSFFTLSFRVALRMGLWAIAIAAVIGIIIALFAAEGFVEGLLIIGGAALAGAVAMLIFIAIIALVSLLQPLIYNAVAWLVGGLRFTLKKQKSEHAVAKFELWQVVKWNLVFLAIGFLFSLAMVSIFAAMGTAEVWTEANAPFAFMLEWPLVAVFVASTLFNVVWSVLFVSIMVLIYNRGAQKKPLLLTLTKATGRSALKRIDAGRFALWMFLYVLVEFVLFVPLLFTESPMTGEPGPVFFMIFFLVLLALSPLIGWLSSILYNWGAKKYGPVVLELR